MADLILEIECERIYAEVPGRGFSATGPIATGGPTASRSIRQFWRKFGDPGYGTMQLWAYVWHMAERLGELTTEDTALLSRGIGRLDDD